MRSAKVKALAMAGAVALAASLPGMASGQSAGLSESVAAVVNDDVISSYDVVQRMRLLMVSSGIQPTEENLPQLQAEALRTLVDEHLEMQELRRAEKQQKMTIVSTDREVDEEIENVARSNGTTKEALLAQLASQGVSADTYRAQVRATSSWQNWVGMRYGSRARVGQDQVKAFERRYNEEQAKPQFEVSEVFIDAARVGGQDVALNGARQLVAQLQQGAPFAAVARQFSASPTAANGGDAGWVSAGTLPKEVDAALDQLRAGQLSAPIPVENGVYIVYLRNKRAGADAALVNLKQVAISLPNNASAGQVDAARAKLEALRPQVTGCDSVETVAGKVDGVMVNDLGESELKDLTPTFQEAIKLLNVGQASAPIRTAGGFHLVTLCGKRAAGATQPTTAQIEGRLRDEQLALISRRYLRDLRNSATIETR